MLKAGLRFPLTRLHRQLLHYLGLSVNQVSPNAWRVFIGVKVLYGSMSTGKKRLTVKEFFHCYRPVEITKSWGMYSFVARKPLLRLVSDTPDSNRDWKSRYFFMDGDEWMGILTGIWYLLLRVLKCDSLIVEKKSFTVHKESITNFLIPSLPTTEWI